MKEERILFFQGEQISNVLYPAGQRCHFSRQRSMLFEVQHMPFNWVIKVALDTNLLFSRNRQIVCRLAQTDQDVGSTPALRIS